MLFTDAASVAIGVHQEAHGDDADLCTHPATVKGLVRGDSFGFGRIQIFGKAIPEVCPSLPVNRIV